MNREEKKMERTKADVKVKNQIARELKQICPTAKVKMTRINAGEGVPEAVDGEVVYITADMGTKYMNEDEGTRAILDKAFDIMEKFNAEYKFDYLVDKKKR